MSVFTQAEIAYLQGQRLGRLATAGANARPHVVPVSFLYNPDSDTIDIGGHGFTGRKKFRDVQANPWVAFVVDDVASVQPWRARGIEVRGQAEVRPQGGESIGPGFDPEMFRVTPRRIVSWGLEGEQMQMNSRSVASG
jgi:pyridoxamine 5'-phosphate oxidase family protein